MDQAEALERDGFMFFRSYIDALEELPQKDQLPVLKAIIRFGLDGTEPTLSGTQRAFFLLAKPNLEKSRKKAANGKKGGSKRKQTESKTEPAFDLQSVCPSRIKDKGQGIKDKGQGIKDKGQGTAAESAADHGPDSRFQQFFDLYPRKTHEDEAKEAWDTLTALQPAIGWMILEGLRLWVLSNDWAEEDGRYIPTPDKFLLEGRWRESPRQGLRDDYESPAWQKLFDEAYGQDTEQLEPETPSGG